MGLHKYRKDRGIIRVLSPNWTAYGMQRGFRLSEPLVYFTVCNYVQAKLDMAVEQQVNTARHNLDQEIRIVSNRARRDREWLDYIAAAEEFGDYVGK